VGKCEKIWRKITRDERDREKGRCLSLPKVRERGER